MSDMVNTLHLLAEEPGSYMGKNANFSGEGFAHMEFEALAMTPADYEKWIDEVKSTASDLTEDEFNTLLETKHVGRKTYTSTHLSFSPAPEGENAGHNHGGNSADTEMDHSEMDHSEMDHSEMNSENTEHSSHGN
ncbi:Quinol oxidase subunit 2 precursor [compost metagenome]